MSCSIALNWLPGILARFAEAYPAVELDVTCMNSDVLAATMIDGFGAPPAARTA